MENRINYYNLLLPLIYLLVGIIMLVNPLFIRNAVNYILGSMIILFGIIYFIKLFMNKNIDLINKVDLLVGILLIGFGLFFIINSPNFFTILPIISGIIIVIDAISLVINSFKLKKITKKYWYISLLISILFLGFGIYLLINASLISNLIVRIIGIILIIDSIIDVINYYHLKEYTLIISKKKDDIIKIGE